MKYRGNIDPLMKWKDGSSGAVVPANDESSMGTSKYSIVAQMTPSHNEQSFTCQTYFEKPQPGSLLTNAAYNIPINNNAYQELYTSPQLTVYCKYCVCWHKCHFCCMLSIFKTCQDIFCVAIQKGVNFILACY